MTKPEMLRIMRLISSLESTILSAKVNLADHLYEEISCAIDYLERDILKADPCELIRHKEQ